MTDKNIKHGKRNSDYWDRLIERYYSGNTTIDEEKELSRFVFSESQNKRYDEIRAVLSYSLIGNSIKGKNRNSKLSNRNNKQSTINNNKRNTKNNIQCKRSIG